MATRKLKPNRTVYRERYGLISVGFQWVYRRPPPAFPEQLRRWTRAADRSPAIPKAWDDNALAGWHVPLATLGAEPVPLTAEEFYRLPELKIFKNYPVYAPGREPAGYMETLRQAKPEVTFDSSLLRTGKDWAREGELVFDAPVTVSALAREPYIGDAGWYRDRHVPVATDGTVPSFRYVIREKGKVEIGGNSCGNSCGNCHTPVLPDGTVWSREHRATFPGCSPTLMRSAACDPLLGTSLDWTLYVPSWSAGPAHRGFRMILASAWPICQWMK